VVRLAGIESRAHGSVAQVSLNLGLASYAIYSLHRRLYMLAYAAILGLAGIDLQVFAP
jgi:hypothetical protein